VNPTSILTDPHEAGYEIDPLLFDRPPLRRHLKGTALPPELLRIGVQFADGEKATNVGGRPFADGQPTGPVMIDGGGGGGGGRWRQSQWV